MTNAQSLFEREERIGRSADRIARALAFAGGAVLVSMTILTVVSISGRALVPLGLGPVPGDFELVEIGCGVAVFFFLPLCQLRGGHVTVDIFSGLLGARGVAVTSLVGNVLMTAAAAVILWRLLLGTADKLRYGEESFILGIPVWWGYAVSSVGAGFFALACAYTVFRSAAALRSGHHARA